ncbi:hypothetical protein ACMFMG_010402 [Clarireedia jacksonii]
MTMKDYFKHTGPNGEHACLVFEPMGRSTASMVEHLPNLLQTEIGTARNPTKMAKSILRQVLLGLDFLHQIGIAHDDVQPGNFLFSAKDLKFVGEETLARPLPLMDEENEILEPKDRFLHQTPIQTRKKKRWKDRYLGPKISMSQPAIDRVCKFR